MTTMNALIISIAATAGLLNFALGLKRRPPMILMYHGVWAGARNTGLQNCEGKHTPVDVFVRHLQILRRSRKVIPLSEMIEGLASGQDMRDTVAITFDDGYENNFLAAAPVLAEFNMPAAFFLTTGFVGTARCIWTDQLEALLDRTERTQVQLPDGAMQLPLSTLKEKRAALLKIKAHLKKKENHELLSTLDALSEQLAVDYIDAEGNYRFMNWDQARKLLNSGFEVGAHTISHPILTKVSFEEARSEILGSRDHVQRETGQCSEIFCFPNGKLSDFNQALQSLCRKHFKAALSSERGHASLEEIYGLRRLCPAGTGKGQNMEWLLLRGK